MRKRFVAFVLPLATLVACASEGDDPPTDQPDAASGSVDAPASTVDASPASLGSLTGKITRSAMPMGDARGPVFVAMFDRDPVANQMTAQVVARAFIENADLAGANAQLAYTLPDIPPRAEDYYLIAFLDDNGNVDVNNPAGAGPDRGDLVSLDGLASPKVKVTAAGMTAHDIVLNSVLPF